MTIPKIIHHITPRDKSVWHPVWSVCLSTWYDHYPEPEYKHMFWMDDEIHSYVLEKFPQYYQTVCDFKYNINRIDFLRWLILYEHGGLYADMDYMPYENFFEDIVKDVAIVLSPHREENYTNCLMASVPKHKMLLKLAEQTIENFNTKVYPDRHETAIDLGVHCPDYVRDKDPDYFDSIVQSLPWEIYNPGMENYHFDPETLEGSKGFHFLSGMWGPEDIEHVKKFARERNITYDQAHKYFFHRKVRVRFHKLTFEKEHNLWKNMLYEDTIDDIDFQSIIDYAYDWKSKCPGIKLSNMGGWHSKYYDDNHPEVDKLISKISAKVSTKILHFWFNINFPGSHNGIHDHQGSIAANSGVFYLNSRSEMGDIVFIESLERGGRGGLKKMSSETGKIYIFPAHMLHGVGKNRTDEDRISVSFNF